MSYSEFSLDDIQDKLGLTLREVRGFFSEIPTIQPSALLQETLAEQIPLALGIDTEKARSELIVSPILVELRRLCDRQISLFSGTDLTVDRARGLNGICDFLVSHSSNQLVMSPPIFTLVEAKNDNLKSGVPQCVAEMLAASILNERKNSPTKQIFGAVTTGSLWKFLRLEADTVEVEMGEHSIESISRILGILKAIVLATKS